jgi:hypothetical protein
MRVCVRLVLISHPDTPCPFVDRVEVELRRTGPSLSLDYRISGDIKSLRFPPTVPAAQADNLWQTTCFEAFIRNRDGPGYFEFNLSPSVEWAAYGFDGYRQGLRRLTDVPDPNIVALEHRRLHELWANLELAGVPGLAARETWRIGLSAVIEDKDGAKSYWALAHPPGAPDFHHKDCFAAVVPPAT